jgi:hypothetical protein
MLARQRHFQPAAQRIAVDRGDRRHGQRREPVQHELTLHDVFLERGRIHLAHLEQVRTRDERVVLPRGDDHARRFGLLNFLDRR